MTNLETAARIAAKNITDDVLWLGSSVENIQGWGELSNLFSDMKEEVLFSLRSYYKETGKLSVTEDCRIVEDDGEVNSYRQLVNAISKELWKR